MIEASLAVQKALVARLNTRPPYPSNDGLTEDEWSAVWDAYQHELSLIPPVRDTSLRPDTFPVTIVGEGQTVLEAITYSRREVRVSADVHFWVEEDGVSWVKNIAGRARKVILKEPISVDEHQVLDVSVAGTRFMRDPGGKLAHALMTVEVLLREIPT